MAIKIDIQDKTRNLFCESKWWGDPDMPEDMEYPMLDGTPLTFLCQIDCYDIAGYDSENLLPREGMLYFFAAMDDLLGYETDYHHGYGQWPKGHAWVKYTKSINMETFKSVIFLDDKDKPVADKPLPLRFSAVDTAYAGLGLLGSVNGERVELLRVPVDPDHTLVFGIKPSDLGFGNWKKAYITLEK